MKEVEIKVKNINKRRVINTIEKLGAQKVFAGKVEDFRYDTQSRKLSKQGKVLRVRQRGEHTFLNVKGKKTSKEGIVKREEISVKVSDIKIIRSLLKELGYSMIFSLKKHRIEYKLEDITFDIDEYPGMSPILEIESDNHPSVERYLKILNIKEEDIGRVYIRELLKAKRQVEIQNSIQKFSSK